LSRALTSQVGRQRPCALLCSTRCFALFSWGTAPS
jgi:hypothetical protein